MTEASYLGAMRAGHDAVAERYAELFRTALDDHPLDRALLGGFAEMVALLDGAGFEVAARLVRAPDPRSSADPTSLPDRQGALN